MEILIKELISARRQAVHMQARERAPGNGVGRTGSEQSAGGAWGQCFGRLCRSLNVKEEPAFGVIRSSI